MNGTSERAWKILLTIHLIAYEAFFIFALHNFRFGAGYVHDYFVILLFWTLLLVFHVGATYRQIGRGDVSRIEREAYRDGFADAMRQLEGRSDPIERLVLDDEGELVELPKRKRREG